MRLEVRNRLRSSTFFLCALDSAVERVRCARSPESVSREWTALSIAPNQTTLPILPTPEVLRLQARMLVVFRGQVLGRRVPFVLCRGNRHLDHDRIARTGKLGSAPFRMTYNKPTPTKGLARQATTWPHRSGSGSAWPRSHFVYGLPGGYCTLLSQAGAQSAGRSSTPFRCAAIGGTNGGTAGRATTTGTNGTTIGIRVVRSGQATGCTTTPPTGMEPARREVGRSRGQTRYGCSESLLNAPTHRTAGVTS